MPKNYIIVEDESIEAAVNKGCISLNASPEEVDINVLQTGKKGIIFSTPFKVKISRKRQNSKNITDDILSTLEDAENFLSSRDGSLKIEKKGKEVFLTVTPPAGNGKNVEVEEVYTHLKYDSGIINIDDNAIIEAFKKENLKKSIKIADYIKELSKDLDSEIYLSVTKDNMQCKLKITPPKGNGLPPTIERVIIELRNRDIKLQPDIEMIESVIEDKKFNEEYTIVKGIPAENGEDSSIDWIVGEFSKKETHAVREDGSVDFKKIFELNNVKTDELLGIKKPPTSGVDGTDIFGNKIPSKPGNERPVKVGKNILISPDGQKFYSMIDGQFSKENGLGSVLPVYEVKGDIDYTEGNVDFYGTVVIDGQVLDGFEVKAGGNICVLKTVGEARLKAGGQVIVGGGFLGKKNGLLKAGSDVLVKFAEGGTIEADENVMVDNAIMHCNVYSGGKVEVKSRKGQIVGGNILAREEVYAKNIGTPLGTKTYITVGVDKLTREKLEHISNLMKISSDKAWKLQQSINHLESLKKRDGKLSSDQEDLSSRIQKALLSINDRIEELEFEKETLEMLLHKRKKGIVRAYQTIYAGVHVTIRSVNYHVKNDIIASSLALDGEKIRISPI